MAVATTRAPVREDQHRIWRSHVASEPSRQRDSGAERRSGGRRTTLPESLLVLALVAILTVFVVGPKVLGPRYSIRPTTRGLTINAPGLDGPHGTIDELRSWAPR